MSSKPSNKLILTRLRSNNLCRRSIVFLHQRRVDSAVTFNELVDKILSLLILQLLFADSCS